MSSCKFVTTLICNPPPHCHGCNFSFIVQIKRSMYYLSFVCFVFLWVECFMFSMTFYCSFNIINYFRPFLVYCAYVHSQQKEQLSIIHRLKFQGKFLDYFTGLENKCLYLSWIHLFAFQCTPLKQPYGTGGSDMRRLRTLLRRGWLISESPSEVTPRATILYMSLLIEHLTGIFVATRCNHTSIIE